MPVNKVSFAKNFGSAITDRYLSPAVWDRFPIQDVIEDPSLGVFDFDDFHNFPLAGTQTTEIAHGRYKVFNTGAGKVSRVSAVNSVEIQGGALEIALDTDNDSGAIADSYPYLYMDGAKATSGLLCAEFCYAQKSVATNMAAIMLLLAEVEGWTLATAVPFNAGDAITNGASGIGFRITEDGLGSVDTVVTDRATSFTAIQSGVATLTANTFTKLGIRYDLDRPGANRISFFVNNVLQSTFYTATQLAATTNLKANALGRIVAACADSGGTAHSSYLKWWACGQLQPGILGG